MGRLITAAAVSILLGLPLSAQTHPGPRSKINEGCGSIYFDEINLVWVCGESTSGGGAAGSSPCSTLLCPEFCAVPNPQGKLGPSNCCAKPAACSDNGKDCTCANKHRPMP